MSDTLRALDEAIQHHIAAAFEGSLVDRWVLVTHSQTLERSNVSNYRVVTPDVQPVHVDRGLLATGEQIVQDSWADGSDDDDD
jgi:hypothetical protein